jgi:hypothetical protein
MLKLTYLETGMHLEQLDQSLERVITQRVLLALRLRHTLVLEPGAASFLVPSTLPELAQLPAESDRPFSVCLSDPDAVEVSLVGLWLSRHTHCEEGLFLVELAPEFEQLLIQLWQSARSRPSSLIH